MTKITRRQRIDARCSGRHGPARVANAHGPAYPEKPVRMIIPIAPGGQTDIVARLLQQTIDKKKLLPQPIVAVNNAAAGGATGTRQVKDSEADGYTIGMFHMGLLTAPAMGVVDYDHSAFELIGQVGRTPVGHWRARGRPLQDHPGRARRSEGKAGDHHGRDEHRPVAALRADDVRAGCRRQIPLRAGRRRRGAAAARCSASTPSSRCSPGPNSCCSSRRASSHWSCSPRRGCPSCPNVPTAKEIGVGTVFEERVIAFAPKGTPKDRIDVIAKALHAAMDDPELVERYKGLGIDRVFIDGSQA